ncbi:MAG TPA: hypothetical protein ENN41_07710 [Sediminispirochaeta sp.]|nr:hypothetical protein [Sediminispirochaeta sp.]
MKKKIETLALSLILIGLAAGPKVDAIAFRGQKPMLNNAPYDLSLGITEELSVTLTHKGPATDYFITFGPGSSGDAAARQMLNDLGEVIQYNVYDNEIAGNILKDGPDPENVLSGSFPAVTQGGPVTETKTFSIIVPPEQFPPAGTYTDTVTLSLYEGSFDNPIGPTGSTVEMSLRVVMEEIIELSLVPPGGVFDSNFQSPQTLDFGYIYPDQTYTRSIDVLARANTPYDLSISSSNSGVMTHVDQNDPSTIPYQLSSNGTPVDLSTGDQLIAGAAGPSGWTGDRYSLIFETMDYAGAAELPSEGDYQDTLTITITAN